MSYVDNQKEERDAIENAKIGDVFYRFRGQKSNGTVTVEKVTKTQIKMSNGQSIMKTTGHTVKSKNSGSYYDYYRPATFSLTERLKEERLKETALDEYTKATQDLNNFLYQYRAKASLENLQKMTYSIQVFREDLQNRQERENRNDSTS